MTDLDRPRSVQETAEWFGRSDATVRRWVRIGWLDVTASGHVTAESIRPC